MVCVHSFWQVSFLSHSVEAPLSETINPTWLFEQMCLPAEWNVGPLGPLSTLWALIVLHPDGIITSPLHLNTSNPNKDVSSGWGALVFITKVKLFSLHPGHVLVIRYPCFVLCAVSSVLNHCQVHRIAAVVYQCYSDVIGPDSVTMETYKPALTKLGRSIQVSCLFFLYLRGVLKGCKARIVTDVQHLGSSGCAPVEDVTAGSDSWWDWVL